MRELFTRALFMVLLTAALALTVHATPPTINNVWQHPPTWIPLNRNITIYSSVIDVDGNLNSVFLDVIRRPDGSNDISNPMSFTGGNWEVSYNGTQRGEYNYRIHAVDTLNEHNYSSNYTFYTLYLDDQSRTINVSVHVLASCCGAITYFYVPEKIIQNQTVVFLLFFQNCGNTRLDEKINNITVYTRNGTYVATWTGPGSPAGGLDPMEESVFWTLWSTAGQSIGNYSAVGQVEYFGMLYNETNITENLTQLSISYNCTGLTADNRSNCTDKVILECSDIPSPTNSTVIATNQTSLIANVTGMNPGTTVYMGGPVVLNGTSYDIYTFNMSSCDEYCYACISNDSSMDGGECAYEDYMVYVEDYFISDVGADGSEVTLRPAEERCNYKLTVWECKQVSSDGTAVCNKTVYCYGTVTVIKDFEIVAQIGEAVVNLTTPSPESGPFPLIIREMPPQINQQPGCNPSDPWNTCTYTTVRFILFNVGLIANASNIVLDEQGSLGNCTIGNCNSVAVRCTNTSEYTCTVLPDPVSSVVFNLTNPLAPRDYVILEYELVPAYNTSAYTNAVNNNYYFFNSTVYFKDLSRPDRANLTYVVYENHPLYNPLPSKLMNLMDVDAFNYNITVSMENNTYTGKGRDFYTNTNTTFNLTVTSLTGQGQTNNAWNMDVPIPNHWTITDCWVPSPSYSCSFTPASLQYSGTTTHATNTDILFRFNASVDYEHFYLLPTNKSLGAGLYEEYIPGLFLLTNEAIEQNVTQNITQNITVNVTTTVTTTVTSTVTTTVTTTVTQTVTTTVTSITVSSTLEPDELRLAIDIKPVNRTVNGTQGVFNPVVFNVSNIGNVPAENITLIPIVPEGWEYKGALVSFLNVSETVNRTIFVKPPYGVTGQYVIPVQAIIGNFTIDMDYFYINIQRAVNITVLEIIEAPRRIELLPNENLTGSILIKNVGKIPLHDIKGRIENAELCLDGFNLEGIPNILPNETRRAYFNILATGQAGRICNSTLIIWSKENAYAFTDTTLYTMSPPPLIPAITKLNLLMVLLIFLAILYVARKSEQKKERKRRRRKKKTGDRIIRLILYLIASVVIFSLIYLAFSYFGGFPSLI